LALLRAQGITRPPLRPLTALKFWDDHNPTTLEIVYLDARLRATARREGFKTLEG
jgi:hypothetical protein